MCEIASLPKLLYLLNEYNEKIIIKKSMNVLFILSDFKEIRNLDITKK